MMQYINSMHARWLAAFSHCSPWPSYFSPLLPFRITFRAVAILTLLPHHLPLSNRLNRLAAQGSSYKEKREAAGEALQTLPEMRMLEQFHTQLRDNTLNTSDISSPHLGPDAAPDMTREQALAAVEAGILTFVSHAEARVASSLGEAFYTIGPCGEELLAVVGQLLEPTDAMALHYRHLATQVARHLPLKGAEQVMLDRARAHTISSRDAVTGGVHCSLGGDDYSFLVTSTLASQTCPAVGRALARGLTYQLKVRERSGEKRGESQQAGSLTL